MLYLSLTFQLNTHLAEIQDWLISSSSTETSCFFQSSSSVDLAAVACFSISVTYTSDSRGFGVCCSIFVFMNFKDVTSLSKSICLILLSPSFTFPSLLYFPVALPDLELIFQIFSPYCILIENEQLHFSLIPVFLFACFHWNYYVTVHLIHLVALKTHWGCLCLSGVYDLLVWCDY